MRHAPTSSWNRLGVIARAPVAVLATVFFLSRFCYWFFGGLRFYEEPLYFYIQNLDVELLRNHLFQSLWFLKEQMPGFNLMQGLILQISGDYHKLAFQVTYLLLSLATALVLRLLLLQLGSRPVVALLISCGYAASPTTALYENWLFYNQPIVFLFTLSLWALQAYVSTRRATPARVLFWSLLGLAMFRSLYHLLWYLFFVGLFLLVLPETRRLTARSAAVPGLLLVGVYLKSLLLFGFPLPGQAVYAGANRWFMRMQSVTPEQLNASVQAGRLPNFVLQSVYDVRYPRDQHLAPRRPPTGIAALDEPVKRNGEPNWNSYWQQDMLQRYLDQIPAFDAEFHSAYPRTVRASLGAYALPESAVWPFLEGQDFPLKPAMRRVLDTYGRMSFCFPGTVRPYAGAAVLLLLLGAAVVRLRHYLLDCWRQRRILADPVQLASFFCLFNITWLALLTILISHQDTPRYRNEVSTLYACLLGLFAMDLLRRWQKRGAAPEPR